MSPVHTYGSTDKTTPPPGYTPPPGGSTSTPEHASFPVDSIIAPLAKEDSVDTPLRRPATPATPPSAHSPDRGNNTNGEGEQNIRNIRLSVTFMPLVLAFLIFISLFLYLHSM